MFPRHGEVLMVEWWLSFPSNQTQMIDLNLQHLLYKGSICSLTQRNGSQAHTGEAARGLQERWQNLQTTDTRGQRGRHQHLEWQLHPADVVPPSCFSLSLPVSYPFDSPPPPVTMRGRSVKCATDFNAFC